jgi:nitric oxide dioxygenase
VAKVEESAEITSFYFEPVDKGPILAAEPGQYIGMKLILDGEEIRRNYSLSALATKASTASASSANRWSCVQPSARSIARRREHSAVPAIGRVHPDASDKPLVLISGGVGITPTLAMLEAALQTERPVHFIHCARNGSVHAFRDWIDGLAARHPQAQALYCYAEDDGVSPAADKVGNAEPGAIGEWLPAQRDVDAYFLGPKGFMGAIKRHLKAWVCRSSRAVMSSSGRRRLE